MTTTKFKYSAGQMLWGVCALLFLEVLFYVEIIDSHANYSSWLLFGGLSLFVLCRLAYLSSMYYIPCLLDKTAVELDNEKLQSFIAGKLLFQIAPGTIYWKDIADIEYVNAYRYGSIISFKMKDGSAAGIYTKNISGNDKEMYQTIMDYFDKNR